MFKKTSFFWCRQRPTCPLFDVSWCVTMWAAVNVKLKTHLYQNITSGAFVCFSLFHTHSSVSGSLIKRKFRAQLWPLAWSVACLKVAVRWCPGFEYTFLSFPSLPVRSWLSLRRWSRSKFNRDLASFSHQVRRFWSIPLFLFSVVIVVLVSLPKFFKSRSLCWLHWDF